MQSELIACPKCARNTNPLRGKCIYCGADLPVEKVSADLIATRVAQSRDLEGAVALDPLTQISTELQQSLSTLSIVVVPDEQSDAHIDSIASISVFSAEDLKVLLASARPVPISRVFNQLEAQALEEKLKRDGIRVRVLDDEKLRPSHPVSRARRLSLEQDELLIVPEVTIESPRRIKATDIRLVVEGRITRRQVHTVEQNKGFGNSEREVADVVELVEQSGVVDFYTDSLDTSFRVREESFDYSGLGGRMKMTAALNFRVLIETLCEMAHPVFDDTFRKTSKLLDTVWPPAKRTEAMGRKRAGVAMPGKITTLSKQSIDNEMQFNRYSMLRYLLLDVANTPTGA